MTSSNSGDRPRKPADPRKNQRDLDRRNSGRRDLDRRDFDRRNFEQQVRAKSRRKVQAQREGDRSLWAGLGLFGMVGWSVMVPTLVGIALGRWVDHRWPSPYSWTLMLLFVGLGLGCWSAWYWIQKEQDR